jgi:hypothetical protein
MKIAFYAAGPKSGLSNNGGSRTILKSAEVLRELGHEVDVVASHDSFTWFSHPKPVRQVPEDADVVVAVSARDVKNAVKSGKPVYWWIRGKELWQMPEEKLIERAKSVRCITNALHLKDWLASHKVNSRVCYAGTDDWEEEERAPREGRRLVVGCLKHTGHKTKRWDMCLDLLSRLDDQRFKVIHTGDPTKTQEQMQEFYNKCDIWFAPTELEGFHNVPAEAGACGCLVVARRDPSGGMRDYCNEETSHLFDTIEEAIGAIESPDFSKVPRFQQKLYQIGSRHSNMYRFAEMICQK